MDTVLRESSLTQQYTHTHADTKRGDIFRELALHLKRPEDCAHEVYLLSRVRFNSEITERFVSLHRIIVQNTKPSYDVGKTPLETSTFCRYTLYKTCWELQLS